MTIATAPTRREARDLAKDAGLTGPAADFAVRIGAPVRHVRRTAIAREALDAAAAAAGYTGYTGVAALLYSLILCYAELAGSGGERGMGGGRAGTARMSWARGLGKGRRHATDGGAWTAAIEAAAREVAADLKKVGASLPLVLCPSDAPLGVGVGFEAPDGRLYMASWLVAEDDLGFARAIAARGLAEACGAVLEEHPIDDLILLRGIPRTDELSDILGWGKMFNAIENARGRGRGQRGMGSPRSGCDESRPQHRGGSRRLRPESIHP